MVCPYRADSALTREKFLFFHFLRYQSEFRIVPNQISRMSRPLKNVFVRLVVGAGQAAPTPPVGPALGSKGVKAIDFCKEFNARTAGIQPGTPMPVALYVKPDRTFTFEIKSPQTAHLLKQAAGVTMGSGTPGKTSVGSISLKHVYEIAKIKQTDQRHSHMSLESICKGVIGVAKTMGIDVVY